MSLSQITFFNRHDSMSAEMMTKIRKTVNRLSELEINTSAIENYLYGAYDGFDYSEITLKSKELLDIISIAPRLGIEIIEIFEIIKTYPRTSEPNPNTNTYE